MLPPVRCPTCGCEIGHKATLYRIIRAARMKKYYAGKGAPLPAMAAYDPNLPEDGLMAGVLDKLKVTECCRIRLTTNVCLSDVY